MQYINRIRLQNLIVDFQAKHLFGAWLMDCDLYLGECKVTTISLRTCMYYISLSSSVAHPVGYGRQLTGMCCWIKYRTSQTPRVTLKLSFPATLLHLVTLSPLPWSPLRHKSKFLGTSEEFDIRLHPASHASGFGKNRRPLGGKVEFFHRRPWLRFAVTHFFAVLLDPFMCMWSLVHIDLHQQYLFNYPLKVSE